jgi:transcription elongation factor Elf1
MVLLIVISGQTYRCNSNYETTLCFIVNSVSVYSKVIDVFENGKDNWCLYNFPNKNESTIAINLENGALQ